MKFTICGFSQRRLIDLKLDHVDAQLLRYFIDFKGSGNMATKIFNKKTFYWLNYNKVIKEIPILKLKKTDSIYRRFKKMVEVGVLEHETKKTKQGTYAFFKTGPVYFSLISDSNSDTNPTNSEELGYKSVPKDSSNNLKDLYIVQSENLWKLYPNKIGKKDAMKKLPKLIKDYSYEQLKRCITRYIDYVQLERKNGFDLRYKNGNTFFNSGFMDYLDENYQEIIEGSSKKTEDVPRQLSGESVDEVFG